MDLNELYKEIEKAEVDLNAKRLKYIKEALVENGGSIKLKFKEFKEFKETNDAFDFDDQFPVIIEIARIPMYLTEVYVKKNDFRIVLRVQGVGRTARVRWSLPCHEVGLAVCGQGRILVR